MFPVVYASKFHTKNLNAHTTFFFFFWTLGLCDSDHAGKVQG